MTKAEFVAMILPAYIAKHADGPDDYGNAQRHAAYVKKLLSDLELSGVKFSEESTTSEEKVNRRITDV